MAIFKLVDWDERGLDKYDQDLIGKEIRYILGESKKIYLENYYLNGEYISGRLVNFYGRNFFMFGDVDYIINQFYMMLQYFEKEHVIQARHFILSFSDYDDITIYQAFTIGQEIIKFFKNYDILC